MYTLFIDNSRTINESTSVLKDHQCILFCTERPDLHTWRFVVTHNLDLKPPQKERLFFTELYTWKRRTFTFIITFLMNLVENNFGRWSFRLSISRRSKKFHREVINVFKCRTKEDSITTRWLPGNGPTSHLLVTWCIRMSLRRPILSNIQY